MRMYEEMAVSSRLWRHAGSQTDKDGGIKSQLMPLCCAPQRAMSER